MVMLQSVFSSVPTYVMSCFKLLQFLCNRIQLALTRFWWDTSPDKRKMSWIAWEKMAKPKIFEGLGFRDITNFNDALLAKLSWRLLSSPKSLLARVLIEKYCTEATFLDCPIPKVCSHGWRSILHGRDLMVKNLGWTIGDEQSVSILQDHWLSLKEQLSPMGPATKSTQNLKVSDLFQDNSTAWDIEKIELILPFHKEAILMLNPSLLGNPDKLCWLGHYSGVYTTKSGYFTASSHQLRDQIAPPLSEIDWHKQVWNLGTAPKVKMFLWKALHEALPVGQQLAWRAILIDPKCSRCDEPESVLHLLFHCQFAQRVWRETLFSSGFDATQVDNLLGGITAVNLCTPLPPIGIESGTLADWTCWTLWIARNQKVFNSREFTPHETILKAIQDAREWKNAQILCEGKLPSVAQRSVSDEIHLSGFGIRCSSDAAWHSGSRSAGLGWVFSDSTWEVARSSSSKLNVSSALVAESLAIREALMEAKAKGFTRLILQSVSMQIIKAIKEKSFILEILSILADISLLCPFLTSIEFKFILRMDNTMADSIAKQALRSLVIRTI